jgi:hypothetical protein
MPNPGRARRNPAPLLVAVVASVVALLATTLSTPALASTHASLRVSATHTKAAKQHDSRFVRAQKALSRAQKAFSPSTPAAERPDATMALRRLVLLKDALSPADRAAADRLTARPSKPATVGDAHILVHYDPAQLNPLAYDQNQALATLQYVADTYANSGYRRPKSDGTKGGDGRIDIYLDTLQPGLYGYCTIDKAPRGPRYDVPAFCVLDNDYAGFPSHTPLENLQVTAAHEYYHATQFAYDVAEDSWFMEATAVWAEDELFTNVNDNVQYLRRSPITMPSRPIDKFEDQGTFHYGVWIFFRFLTERYPAKTGALPGLPLKMWQYADSSKGPRKDLYSSQAINKALKKVGHTSLPEQFASFSAATRYPGVFSEGIANGYPAKRLGGRAGLTAHKRKTFKTKLDHLSSSTFEFVPGGGTSQLKLRFKMAPKAQGSRAVVVVLGVTGAILQVKNVKVNRRGVASKKFAFDANIGAVDVTLVNASIKFKDCYRHTRNAISCSGLAPFDNARAQVQGKAT